MTAKELCYKVGIDENKLHHWVMKGLVSADNDSPGRGKRRAYSELSLKQASIAASLLKYEMSVNGMKLWMREREHDQ